MHWQGNALEMGCGDLFFFLVSWPLVHEDKEAETLTESFFRFILHTDWFPLPPLLPVPPSPYPSPSTLPLSPCKEGQASHGHEKSTAHQVEVELSSPPCVKAGQGNPAGGTGSPKATKH